MVWNRVERVFDIEEDQHLPFGLLNEVVNQFHCMDLRFPSMLEALQLLSDRGSEEAIEIFLIYLHQSVRY